MRIRISEKVLKKSLWVLLIGFVAIQFFRPSLNVSALPATADISTKFTVPDDVHQVLKTSCYNCHSNNTVYPWYYYIQPVAWWLNDHIKDGKKHLNFDEYATYNLRRQYHKLEEIEEVLKDDEMPLPSYLIIHGDAKLSPEQKEKITAWSNHCMDSMKAVYPLDSLVKKK